MHQMIEQKHLKTVIEVDGGINRENIHTVLDAGADVIVMGSSIFNGNITENTGYFVGEMNS